MNRKEKITEFVRAVFSMYRISHNQFFKELDPKTGDRHPIPLFAGDDIDDDTIKRISAVTGLSPAEIIECDMVAASRYKEKYPFVGLMQKYEDTWGWNTKFSSPRLTQEEMLLRSIFGEEKTNIQLKKRYDYHSVTKRMIKQLRDIDKVMPGTFHEGAEITKLEISTEVFMSFPEIKEMLCSLFSMVEFAKKMFFKGLHEELSEGEILEYNFIVNQLDICDVCMPHTRITYDNLQAYKKAYIEEGFEDFYAYAKVKAVIDSCPWRCKEFFEDMSVVQQFVDIFPQAKVAMRQFALEVTKFSCYFVWSDAKPIMDSPEEEELWADWFAAIGEEPTPLSKRAKEPTHIYVDKSESELYDWAPYIQNLNKVTSPVAKGGISVRPYDMGNLTFRLIRRVDAKTGGGSNG